MSSPARVVTFYEDGETELACVRVLRAIADWIEQNPLSYHESIFLIHVAPQSNGARGELVIRRYEEEEGCPRDWFRKDCDLL